MTKNNISIIKLYVTSEELTKIAENSVRWNRGDIAAWVRYSAVFGQPRFEHLEDSKEVDEFFKLQVERKNLRVVSNFERQKIYMRLKPLGKKKGERD